MAYRKYIGFVEHLINGVALLPFLYLLKEGFALENAFSYIVAIGFLLPTVLGFIHTLKFVKLPQINWAAFALRWLSLSIGTWFFAMVLSVQISPPATTGDVWLFIFPVSVLRIAFVFVLSVEDIEAAWRNVEKRVRL